MDLKDIKVIIDLMKKNSLSEFELEKEGFKIKLKRGTPGGGRSLADEWPGPIVATAPPVLVPAGTVTAAPSAPPPAATGLELIKSPMIGSFYRSPAPDAAPYVEVGSEVEPDTVVCIIEAMKVMNEIKAEVRGVIAEVVAENGKPVEFGQPLFKVRPT